MGPTLKLVLLECDASFPSDLAHTTLHPMIVYIQIARQKVCEGGGEGRREGGKKGGRTVAAHVKSFHSHRCYKSW